MQVLACNGQQGAFAGGSSHGAIQHQARKDHRQQAADYLAGLDPADGQLDDHMACVDQKQHDLDENQIEVRQQLGGHQLHQQHQAADHQQAHGRYTEPVGTGAVEPVPSAAGLFLFVHKRFVLSVLRVHNRRLAPENLLDQVLGSGDHPFIGQDHGVPGVISQTVAIVGAVFAGKAVCSDVPAGHIL